MTNKHILMLAAENDMLPGAKVGGVGDVVRDLPLALAQEGCSVDVLIPSYGFLARLPGLKPVGDIDVHFAGASRRVQIYELATPTETVNNYIIHSELFSPQGEKVYCDDPEWQPFATDATKFAFFCQATATSLREKIFRTPEIIHLHDWHASFLLLLREYSAEFASLKGIPCVFTIHNLAMQGVRPFNGHESALETWFPGMPYDGARISDPENPHCVNPLRAAIVLADKVSTVSPSYAQEIQASSDHAAGIYGGEGLEAELRARSQEGSLVGILNGCAYARKTSIKKPARSMVADVAREKLLSWAGQSREMLAAHWIAEKRMDELKKSRKGRFVLSSVGRLTEQKARLLLTRLPNGKWVLEEILLLLGEGGLFVLLGSGDRALEDKVTELAGKYDNLIFLNGYSDRLSSLIYTWGDLFLMPSSFEPCGISQMLAMRGGQPCLVNSVGGLKDTVLDAGNGFVFQGRNVNEQAIALITRLAEVMNVYHENQEAWSGIRYRASQARFTWKAAAKAYVSQLYATA